MGRSLDPLPGEDLGGYLLRLASRLNVAPLHLARITGCSGPMSSLRRALLLTEPSDQFADATRLTHQEARSLTLLDWAPFYPPIASSLSRDARLSDRWLFNNTSRFCPRCLAGDESALQRRYGGVWRKEWHLPVSFACLSHEILLRDGCTREHSPQGGEKLLISQGADATLHPAQCRSPRPDTPSRRGRAKSPCGVRLDQVPIDAAALAPNTVTAQRRILDHLGPTSTTEAAGCYFADLRAITTFLRAAWPYSRDLIDPSAHHAVDDDVRALRSWNYQPSNSRLLDKPPASAAAGAALLTTAVEILDSTTRQSALFGYAKASQDRRLGRMPWSDTLTQQIGQCSPALRRVFEPLIFATWRASRSHDTTTTAYSAGYRAEHIPAFLEQDWYLQHLAPIVHGNRAGIARRFAAATLVQWSTRGSIAEAARYLGFGRRAPYAPSRTLHEWLLSLGMERFDRALHNLAQRLDAAPRLIDYHRRRDALRGWYLTPNQWHKITNCLPPVRGRPPRPGLDDHKRQEASIVIWAHLTQGEPCFAPCPIEAAQPEHIQRAWRASRPAAILQLTRPDPGPHYAALQTRLKQHAQQLAVQIDHDT